MTCDAMTSNKFKTAMRSATSSDAIVFIADRDPPKDIRPC